MGTLGLRLAFTQIQVNMAGFLASDSLFGRVEVDLEGNPV